jgi:ABC-type transporter Mla subunit MlaD
MTRQAIVGLFSIAAILALFVMFWFVKNLGNSIGGYRFAVHFPSAAGLSGGSQVFESGVPVGTVEEINLDKSDFSVEIVMALKSGVDIPVDSRFIVQAPLTGNSALVIIPPRRELAAAPARFYPHEIMPRDQQPVGGTAPSINDLVQGGRDELRRVDSMLGLLEKRAPALMDSLQSAANNANALAIHGNQLTQDLSTRLLAMTDTLERSLDAAGGNIVAMTVDFKETTHNNRGRIDSMLTRLNNAALSLNQAVDSMRDLAANPNVHANLIDTTNSIAHAADRLAQMADDARSVSGNAQTQAQLRDTVANIDALTQKANALLGSLGAKSSVYGVDSGATPAPGSPNAPIIPPSSSGAPGAKSTPAAATHFSFNKVMHSLVGVQVRVAEQDAGRANTFNSPTITSGRGPISDFNIVALPHASTSFVAGANALGGATTYNFAMLNNYGNGLRAGGGVLYSRLGLISQYQPGALGIEGRLYDPQHPTLDMYGNLIAFPNATLFGGERDILHSGRRTVFGLQLDF